MYPMTIHPKLHLHCCWSMPIITRNFESIKFVKRITCGVSKEAWPNGSTSVNLSLIPSSTFHATSITNSMEPDQAVKRKVANENWKTCKKRWETISIWWGISIMTYVTDKWWVLPTKKVDCDNFSEINKVINPVAKMSTFQGA